MASTEDAAKKPTKSMHLTDQGTVLGTLPYMAPEQVEGRPADARTDTFALGVVLYEMITGRAPFQGTNQAGLTAAILTHEPPPISSWIPTAPASLDRVVKKCLFKDHDERWHIRATASAVTNSGDLLALNRGGGDDHVAFGDDVGHQLALPLIKRFVLNLGVAAGRFGLLGLERQLDELCAEAFDLLAAGGTDVVGPHDRAQPLGRGDRREARHADADHKHAGGRERAGGRHHQRKNLGQLDGGQQHGAIAGERGHRGQHVHRLGPRRPRNQLQGEERRAGSGDFRDGLRLAERIAQADHESGRLRMSGNIAARPACRFAPRLRTCSTMSAENAPARLAAS